jgi:SAM-dependent methyltransferase
MAGTRAPHCPVCGGIDLTEVFSAATAVPVFCNWLYDDQAEALAATTGEVRLVACATCGHVFNASHDEALLAYGAGYENSLHYSPTFQRYAQELAERLVDAHGLRGGTVLEVGCGKGDFLAMLVEHGAGRALGYDPSYDGEQAGRVADERVVFVPALLPDRLDGLDVDLVCARHVLEHLERPAEVAGTVRAALGSRGAVVYAEVPDGGYLLDETAVWDVIYEHPSHFTASSLHRLLTDAALPVTALGTSFGRQYLWAEASSSPQVDAVPPPPVEAVLDAAADFATRAASAVTHWADVLDEAAAVGRQVAVWGTGSKGVTFLNVVPGGGGVQQVVDVNPRKHGRYVPGTGQRVVAPDELSAAPPDLVVVMNPLYVDEVRSTLGRLGLDAEVRSAVTSTALMS